MNPNHGSHHEPIVTFATKTGRRMFLFLGSVVFVISCAGLLGLAVYLFATQGPGHFIAWLGIIIGPIGVVFFGFTAITVPLKQFGPKGDIGLVMSPAGFTDNTQLASPAGVIPWSFIAQYDVIVFHGQPMLAMQLQQPEAYRRALGSSKLLQWAFKANTAIMKGPVHAIVLQHLQASEQDLIGAIYHFTGLPPGHRVTATGD